MGEPVDEGSTAEVHPTEDGAGIVIISYAQTYLELPVRQAALEVCRYESPLAVVSFTGTLHRSPPAAVLPARENPTSYDVTDSIASARVSEVARG
jgi:hypothetical protein